MLDIGYETISEIFKDITHNKDFLWTSGSIKFLAIVFFLLNTFTNFTDGMTKDWGSATIPFNLNKLVSSLVIVVLIAVFDELLNLLDNLFTPLDTSLRKYDISATSYSDLLPEKPDPNKKTDFWGRLLETMGNIENIMKFPQFGVIKAGYYILWILDNVVFALFLFERFFFLTALKLLGPIIFCLAIFDKFRDLMFKWFKLYAAVWLMILPFFLAMYVSNELFTTLTAQALEKSPAMPLPSIQMTSTFVVMGFTVWVKFRLLKKTSDIIFKTF